MTTLERLKKHRDEYVQQQAAIIGAIQALDREIAAEEAAVVPEPDPAPEPTPEPEPEAEA